jgi:hypothetical protein
MRHCDASQGTGSPSLDCGGLLMVIPAHGLQTFRESAGDAFYLPGL